MSLHQAAQHLSAHGRGPDTTLVHMSKGEVKSLNDIAMAHGGHLTINPHTGLPEAGFLSSLLPMIAGAGLTAVSGGAINPMTASLLVGGVTGVMTGSLSKGLMAGLGAYGGAGLGSSLASSGMQAEAAAAEAAKTGPFAANATPAAVPAAPPPINYSAIGAPDVTSSVIAQPGNVADVLTKAPAAAPLGAPMTAAGTPVANLSASQNLGYMGKGLSTLGTGEGWSQLASNAGGGMDLAKYGLAAAAPTISEAMTSKSVQKPAEDKDMGQRYEYNPGAVTPTPKADPYGREQRYYNPSYTPISNERAKSIYGYADGGVATATPQPGEQPSYEYDPMKQLFAKIESMPSDDQSKEAAEAKSKIQQGGGPQQPNKAFDAMMATPEGRAAHEAQLGQINSFLSNVATLAIPGMGLAKFMQANAPASSAAPGASSSGTGHGSTTSAGNVGTGNGSTASGLGTGIGASVGNAGGGLKAGGLSDAHYNLGGYSDGGRLLRGPGDGVSDSIPAVIGKKQPARLADGEFVVPARIVSELGNGSTEAGARKLYAMMDRIQKARGSTVGKGKVAKNSRAEKYLPA